MHRPGQVMSQGFFVIRIGTELALNKGVSHKTSPWTTQPVMKFRFFVLPIIFILVLFLLFSGSYLYLAEEDIMVVPNESGNPTLVLDDGIYYVRYWNLAPGCYRLTRVGIVNYNIASQADESKCLEKALAEMN